MGKLDISKRNGSDKWELPIGGTSVVDAKGLVRFAQVDLNFITRPRKSRSCTRGAEQDIPAEGRSKVKIIPLRIHGILDYVTVAAFFMIPSLFALSGTPAYLSYVLALVHFLMTLLTGFQFGIWKIIPIRVHKIVETIVGPALIALPWICRFSDDLAARYVFIGAGFVILAVGTMTNYSASR
jgi:hypothetical protein